MNDANNCAGESTGRLTGDDRERKARAEVDGKLLEALDSGPALPWTAEDLEVLKGRVRECFPEARDGA